MPERWEKRLPEYRHYLRVLAGMQFTPALRGRVDPSDIVQQSLLKAHRGVKDFRGRSEGEFAAWLRQILANELAHQLRDNFRAKRDVSREQSMSQAVEASSLHLERLLRDDQPSPVDQAAKNERAVSMANAIASLPETQRMAIELHYWNQWSLSQIAQHQGVSKSAVAGAIRRGLKSLQQSLHGDDSKSDS